MPANFLAHPSLQDLQQLYRALLMCGEAGVVLALIALALLLYWVRIAPGDPNS